VRRIGERALRAAFQQIRSGGRIGQHAGRSRGAGGDQLEETKPYSFGEASGLHVQRTIMNTLVREGGGKPVRVRPSDFEVLQTETPRMCSTVVLLDMSRSMIGPRFLAARNVALALNTLIRSRYPRDKVYLVAFSFLTRLVQPHMLLDPAWVESGGGTNFQAALRQARLLLAADRRHRRQIIMLTDGEPTRYSYYVPWGPPRDEGDGTNVDDTTDGLGQTLKEVVRCSRDDININVFLVDQPERPALPSFVRSMLRLNKGRAFLPSADQLGHYVVLDYLANGRA
jgi:uncharacterized protein with von Willebrand factor type A (vWA) domain